MMPTDVGSSGCLLDNVCGSPQEAQLAFMTLQRCVVKLQKEALSKNGVIENLQKLISERTLWNLIESLAFKVLEEDSGKESEFCDWEFQVTNFVQGHGDFEEHLDVCKKRETLKAAQVEFRTTLEENGEAKLQWLDEQLCTILAAFCRGPALQMAKNVRTECGVRGGTAWHKLTREVAGKS